VAEFRDPWATASREVRPRSRLRARVDRAIENGIVQRADRVVVTADRTAAELQAAHPVLSPDRIAVVRNGFDPVKANGSPPGPDEPVRFVFVGNMPQHVSVEPLLSAMARVADRRPGELTLQVVGARGPWMTAAERIGHPKWLRLDGLAPATTVRTAVASASVNVLCRPGHEDKGIVPAKMYEYIGAKRPILGIVPAHSEMERVGRRFGDLRAVHTYTQDALEREITALIDEHRDGSLAAPTVPLESLEELTWESQVARLARLLDDVVDDGRV
jgi:hypothetical protein